MGYLAFLIYRIINDKPLIQITYEYLDKLSIPEIELCGDHSDIEISKCIFHWNNNENSTDGCSPESKIFESEKVTTVDQDGVKHCYTLRANSSYFFSDSEKISEGLSVGGIDFYFKILNISAVIEHFLSVGTITGKIMDKEFKNLSPTNPVKKRLDQQMNTFAGIQNVSALIFFKKTTLSTLPDDISTILGLPPNYISTPFFTTVSKYFQMHPNDSFPFTGHFYVAPGSFLHEVQSEKRSYTVLGTLGVAGGAIGLIGGIYMLFFGQPRINPCDGRSRCFGFIGYRTEKEANEAIKYFNNTYIYTSKVIVELAKPVDDSSLPRPWSAYIKFEASFPNNIKTKNSVDDDEKLNEFLQVMQPRSKSKTWTNDDEITNLDFQNKMIIDNSDEEDDNLYQDLPSSKNKKNAADLDDKKDDERENIDKDPSSSADNMKIPYSIDLRKNPESKNSDEMPPEESIGETGRLFVRNLPYLATEEDLQKLFNKYGPLAEVHLPIDKETKIQKGSNLKMQREMKQKSLAGNDFNWNTLYMNSDAIVQSIAKRLDIKKSDILDPNSDNMAAKLALAETHIIQETKGYFEQQGVKLESFNKKEKSDTIILVKNMPFGVAKEELQQIFGWYGDIERYKNSTEAKTAFQDLAYKKFKGVPLYLEKAPKDIFQLDSANLDNETRPPLSSADLVESSSNNNIGSNKNNEGGQEEDEDMEVVTSSEIAATLFVKNISFDTTEESLKNTFKNTPGLRSVRIKMKNDPKNPGKKLSMGFGFIEYDGMKTAKNALKGYILDGHALQLKFSNHGLDSVQRQRKEEENDKKRQESTKIVVKNLAFETTKKDLSELFSVYGQIKTIRLPKKFDGQIRGFGFIEFLTKRDARNVIDKLQHTHLLGRHLILQYAEKDKDLEELREKISKEYINDDEKMMSTKKRKKVDFDDWIEVNQNQNEGEEEDDDEVIIQQEGKGGKVGGGGGDNGRKKMRSRRKKK
ncbi:2004_t:CDS:10 [Entrophospora sp. SA101]|nr:2004_t:CDS:10 [Entrophospora sp. SA101]